MALGSIESKIFIKVFKIKNGNNFLSIGDKDMEILPLDASCYDESDELWFIFLWPIDNKTPLYQSLELIIIPHLKN